MTSTRDGQLRTMAAGGDNIVVPASCGISWSSRAGRYWADFPGRQEGRLPMATRRMHPETAVLTRGFDPRLSVGSARPPVYRTSTYVFSSPEAAEHAFAVALGRAEPDEVEVGDLIYARLSHPNAEIVEDQLVPLEPGAEAAAV